MILCQIRKTLNTFSLMQNQHESLVSLDFNLPERRAALMRLCFSSLSAWVLFFSFFILYVNPFRYHFSISSSLGLENIFVQSLFGANMWGSVILVTALFILNFILRKEFWFIAVIAYLVSQGDMHLILALICLAAITAGRILSHLRWTRSLEGSTQLVWAVVSLLSFLAWAAAVYTSLEFYNYLSYAGYFSQNMFANRFEAFTLATAIYYGFELLVMICWGHFFAKRIDDPSQISVRYSSAQILNKLLLGSAFKKDLRIKAEELLAQKTVYSEKDLDLLPKRLVNLHQKEEAFLIKASQ